MKKIKALSALFVLFTALTFTSCDTEPVDGELVGNNPDTENPNNPNNPNNPATGIFKVDYDGQTHIAANATAVVNDEYIMITGLMNDGSAVVMTIPNGTVGTFEHPETEPDITVLPLALAYNPGGGQNTFVSSSDIWGQWNEYPEYVDNAQVVISSINNQNNTIEGTFRFTGARVINFTTSEIETKVLTNGSFSLAFTEEVPSIPTNDTFFAKLDGQDFVPTSITGDELMGRIIIKGMRGTSENIGITVPANVTAGTYQIVAWSIDYSGMYVQNISTLFNATSGTIVITNHDTTNRRIQGTFNYTASMFGQSGSHQITEGTFNVGY